MFDFSLQTLQDPNHTFTFDLEYAKASGLNNLEGAAPVLQLVFQYSIVLPDASQEVAPGADPAARR